MNPFPHFANTISPSAVTITYPWTLSFATHCRRSAGFPAFSEAPQFCPHIIEGSCLAVELPSGIYGNRLRIF